MHFFRKNNIMFVVKKIFQFAMLCFLTNLQFSIVEGLENCVQIC